MERKPRKLRKRKLGKLSFGELRLRKLRQRHERCWRCRRRMFRVNRRLVHPMIFRHRLTVWRVLLALIILGFNGHRGVDIHIKIRLRYRDLGNGCRLLMD